MSKISVAMTTYNGECFVVEQLQSLLEQTMQPDEVVICDDCSSDDTLGIIEYFIQKNNLGNWKVIRNNANMGYVRNFRKAITATTGDIVFLCDQDDLWDAEKIALMVNVMEENPHILALVCAYRLINAVGERGCVQRPKFYIPPKKVGVLSKVKKGKVLYANIAQGCTGAYRRSVLDLYCQVAECNIIPHDWAIHMLAYEHGELYFYNRELVDYRIHDHNTTGMTFDGRQAVLAKDVRCLDDAKNLPLGSSTINQLNYIADFYRHRIKWLQTSGFSVWLQGWIRYFPLLIFGFWRQYLKDFFAGLKSFAYK